MSDQVTTAASLELYWIPLGAGASVVRFSGRCFERIVSRRARRSPRPLFHSALVATTPAGRRTIEMAPIPDAAGEARGVVATGAVGSRFLGRWRVFRYEVRSWPNGEIPDLGSAVGGPILLTRDIDLIERVQAVVREVPAPVWGRDELHAGEMWNSNSVTSWTLSCAGLLEPAGPPPTGGRAPGWDAGVTVARRAGGAVRAGGRSRCELRCG